MQLPVNVILDSINTFCVFFFKDTIKNDAVPPHLYIVIPIQTKILFIICIITSQIEPREQFYKKSNSDALSALVYLNNKNFDFITKDCIIDCNQTELLLKSEFINRVNQSYPYEIKCWDIPKPLKIDIVKSIKNSPIVKVKIKKTLPHIETL